MKGNYMPVVSCRSKCYFYVLFQGRTEMLRVYKK